MMKKLFGFMIILAVCSSQLRGQTITRTMEDEDTHHISSGFLEIKADSFLKNPDNWDKVFDILTLKISNKNSIYSKWIKDLNIDFKTFQNKDSTQTSLGFSYDTKIERAKIKENGDLRKISGIAFESKGNVAFNKKVNPNDFLNSKISIGNYFSRGGITIKGTTETFLVHLAELRKRMALLDSNKKITDTKEWKEFNDAFKIKNTWIAKYDVNAGLESNQDFSKMQHTLGIRLGTTVKAWNKNNILSKLNILDYPFQLIRLITNYNRNVHPGVTTPTALVGFDYVTPTKDSIRNKIENNSKPFPRINLEISFRTIITEISSQTLYFNSSFKYFKELGASENIIKNKLDKYKFFTSSITSSNGFFVSYTFGNLPFDRKSDGIYEVGFRYKFE